MARKREGSSHMPLYYRERSTKAASNISLWSELLLNYWMIQFQGEDFFTKSALHYGYHHMRMRQEDISKKSFRTPHEAHYQFFVMLSGLTNAPSTFQSLMSSIFEPFLRKWVCVLFVEYSKYWEEHVQHADIVTVLIVLEQRQLYENPSRCAFGV